MYGVDLILVAIVAVQCRVRVVSWAELTSLLLVVVARLAASIVNVALMSILVACLVGPVVHVAVGPVVGHAIAIVASPAVAGESLWSADIIIPYSSNNVSLGH